MVSIVIPVFNVEIYISKCLDSCLSQTYKNIEIILINDGSLDKSGMILEEYSQKDSRIKVIHQSNKGVVVAREKGIQIAKGDYITFVDGDDYIEKDYIEKLITKCKNNLCDIVVCGYNVVDDNSNLICKRENVLLGNLDNEKMTSLLLKKCTWALWGKLYRKKIFDSVEMPYGQKIGEDGVVCFQVFKRATYIETINESLYNYLQRKNSVTRQKNNSLSLDIIKFIEYIKAIVKPESNQIIHRAYKNFVVSQVYVYYINGGNIDYLLENLEERFTIKEILSYSLNIKEKIIGILVYNSKLISILLYKLYINLYSRR